MSRRALPEARQFSPPRGFQWDAPAELVAQWAGAPAAAASDDPNTIQILDVIGQGWDGAGFTAKRCAAALRAIGAKPVTVQINSPGGDVFEGMTIYNLLRRHAAEVTVEVLGWAASVASIIAMAGDRIVMATGTQMMVHNCWGIVLGNRHDMREAATLFDGFDAALVDVYEARTGQKRAEIERLMDAETFMSPAEAVAKGFADATDDSRSAATQAAVPGRDEGLMARRAIERALAAAGHTRPARDGLLNTFLNSAAQRDAGRLAERDAGILAALRRLETTISS